MSRLSATGGWLRRRAETVSVLLLATMFVAILTQVFFRYFINFPLGWTDELSLAAWLWLVLWGAAFVVRDDEEIRFELIRASVRPGVRRAMAATAAFAFVVLLGLSLPAIADYVLFMRVQRTAYLGIRFDWLFAVYLLFAAAAIVRHLWLGWRAVLGRDAPEPEASGQDERQDPRR
ncbi:MAG: TRAP transporter small permease [Alphaproteobacteria bacterium]